MSLNYIFKAIILIACLAIKAEAIEIDHQLNITNEPNGIKIIFTIPKGVNLNFKQQAKKLIINSSATIKLKKNIQKNNLIQNIVLTKNKRTIYIELHNSNLKIINSSSKKFLIFKVELPNQSVKKVKIENLGNKNNLKLKKLSIPSSPVIKKPLAAVINESTFFTKEKDNQDIILNFNWQQQVAAAVFWRSNYLWIIFNKALPFNMPIVIEDFNNQAMNIEQLDNNGSTIIRFAIENLRNITTTNEGFKWQIRLSKNHNQSSVLTRSIQQYPTPASQGVFFPIQLMAELLYVVDPLIGDQLIVLPLYKSSNKVENNRSFIDFNILSTSQGFVINPLVDQLDVQKIKAGIEIITSKKNYSTDILPYKDENQSSISLPAEQYSLLPYARYKNLLSRDIDLTILKKQATSLESQLELAKIYLALDFNLEANGLFKYINQNNSQLANNLEDQLAQVVTNFCLNRYDEAKIMIDNLVNKVVHNEELKFWQDNINLALNKATQANVAEFIKYKDKFLANYPVKLLNSLANLAIKINIANQEYPQVLEILDFIKPMVKYPSAEHANYLYNKGLYNKALLQPTEAKKLWQELLFLYADPKNRARGNFELTKLALENNQLTIDLALEKLEELKYIWRNSNEEYQIINYQAQLYLSKKNYLAALRNWKKIVTYLPQYGDILDITSKMSRLFSQLFNSTNKELDDFQAVNIFYEFKELNPIGKLGDEVVQQLAYKLVNLDLLDKAAALLKHQLDFRLNGVKRLEIGEKLIAIYLMNKQPEEALNIIKLLDPKTSELKANLLYLNAQALINLAKYQQAINLLANNNSQIALDLKLEAYWHQNDCLGYSSVLMPILNHEQLSNRILTKKRNEDLLRLAICYSKNNQETKITELLVNFSEKIEPSVDIKSTIEFLASHSWLDYKDLEKSLKISEIQGFLSSYKKSFLNN